MRILLPALLAGLVSCVVPTPAGAEAASAASPYAIPGSPAGPPEVATWRAVVSPYTMHYSFDSHHKPVVLLGLQREGPDGVVWGGAVFDNSFGQPSAYVFGGKRLYGWSRWEPLYAEWTAGLLYGYTGEYRHKVPLNYKGFSPGAVGSIGWQFSPTVAAQIDVLGTSALMLHFSMNLP